MSTETKIDKYIEIVVIPRAKNSKQNRKNVGIELDEIKILEILSQNYKKVIITCLSPPPMV